jgi:hypothetical protein
MGEQMADIETTVKTDLSYLKTHLALMAVVVVLAGGAVYTVESIVAKHDAVTEAKDSQILAAVTVQTTDLKNRMTQDEQAATVRDAQYAQIISTLSATIQKQTTQLQQQIKLNTTLNAAQTALAITQKTQAQPGEVVAQNDTVVLDLPIARTINSSLDTLQTTTAQLDETKKQLDAQLHLTEDANLDIVNTKRVIASQATQLVDADKVCKDQIAIVKSQARKSKLKWFSVGYVLGLVTAHFVGI